MSGNTLICSVIYPGAVPFLNDFYTGVTRAIEAVGSGVTVLLVADGVDELGIPSALSGITDTCQAPAGSSIAQVRGYLFEQLRERRGIDQVVFADADDILTRHAVTLHGQALANADFSYSDQILIDEHGAALGRTLFQSWQVPDRLDDPRQLLRGNFVGLSGFACRHHSLLALPRAVPADLVAVDWWLATRLLLAGQRGALTSSPVVSYRQGPSHTSTERLQQSFNACRQHFLALSDWGEGATSLKALEKLAAVGTASLSRDPYAKPWFADIMNQALAGS